MVPAVLAEIDRRAGEPIIDLSTVARSLGKSPRRLQHALAAEGSSYRRLLRQCRMTRAKALMADASLSIAQIAERSSYANASTFHRAFVADTGVTPMQFRRGMQR